jgi:hypothetical protein
MNIQARLARAEKRSIPTDPYHAMTDDDLELAIVACRRTIETGMGMSQAEIVKHFESLLSAGTQAKAEAKLMQGFIAGVTLEAEMEKTLGRPIGAFA